MIVILTGAKKNVGDYLIADRAKNLLRRYVDDEIVELNRFRPLDGSLDIINKSKGLVLCGGPAYASNIYPGIYPLVRDISRIDVPIIPFGLGWCGKPFKNPNAFSFTADAREFLERIHSRIQFSSCRDNITYEILKRHGLNNVLMTGCPVWYDLDNMNKKSPHIGKVKKIVFTTGANVRLFRQTLELLKAIRRAFGEAEIFLSFHRGILPDKHTSIRASLVYSALALASKRYRAKVVDVSYDLRRSRFYEECDLHIGYRVHAHLYFLSKRLPSILINEDGRGLGMTETLGLPVFNYDDAALIHDIMKQVEAYISSDFRDFQRVGMLIDGNLEVMKQFLKSITRA